MTVADRLDRLRAVADGCSLAAFGDLRTRLMLRVSSDHPWPQERLDELCTQAVRCFDRADSSAISSHLLGGARGVVNEALELGDNEIKLFVRSDADPSDVICCVCHSLTDLPVLTNAARDVMRDI
ncbi:hypothetical protein [Albibacillus kandeliae]|uniref:hypothetical protein n=1 Tax=Albibacillus kandeliae TaxID=2174228 RepID=UPI000D68A32D|nr:hypothetical protein [Albibacillus kandeliae]